MAYDDNPFSPSDSDRWAIWEMLVRRDIDAFLAQDWSATAPDFKADGFFGIDAGKARDPDAWRLAFPDLDAYRDEWMRQARETQAAADLRQAREALFQATNLTEIELGGDTAVAHKKFDGHMPLARGGADRLNWQTLYICKRIGGRWAIASFVGYMPHKPG